MKLPTIRTRIQTRFSDTDAMGHFSSGSYVTFMEVGRLEFYRQLHELTGQQPATVVANINIDFLRESHYGEELEVTSWCSRLGSKSMTISSEITANGTLVARGTVTSVGFDRITRRSATLPTDWQLSDAPESAAPAAH